MKAYDEDAKYILFINKSIIILGCSTVNSLTIGFLGHIFQQQCQSKIMNPLSFTLMGGYDLVIPITSLFYEPNNLKNLVNII